MTAVPPEPDPGNTPDLEPGGGFMPFSAGPAICPGQNLVLFIAATALANLLRGNAFTLESTPTIDPSAAVPATLNHYSMLLRATALEESPHP